MDKGSLNYEFDASKYLINLVIGLVIKYIVLWSGILIRNITWLFEVQNRVI